MHGNESTTTKALFDVLNVFADDDSKDVKKILNDCTIAIIPMLNPDGAKAYTRTNANDIDLNSLAWGQIFLRRMQTSLHPSGACRVQFPLAHVLDRHRKQ